MNNKHTSVTALVPAYQAGEFIQPTLDSLSAQTRSDFNLLTAEQQTYGAIALTFLSSQSNLLAGREVE